jgi:hypothetical protein
MDIVPKRPVLTLSKRYRHQRESNRWAPTITSAARRRSVPDHLQSGYKRDARMDNLDNIIHLTIRAPSRVSPQTFVNFVYLYVNKLFTT